VEYEAIPIVLFGLGGLLLLLVPFMDRGRSRLWGIAGLVGLAFVVGMTCWGYGTLIPLYIVFLTALLLAVFAFITRSPEAR
jgi:peptidoglycan/LPS O-acetylase OafA/YrhL